MEQPTAAAGNTPEEIVGALEALCRPYGEVLSIGLFCLQENPDEALCLVDMRSGLSAAANAIGGELFGSRICRHWRLAEGFRCGGRAQGKLLAASCDDCNTRPHRHIAAGGKEEK